MTKAPTVTGADRRRIAELAAQNREAALHSSQPQRVVLPRPKKGSPLDDPRVDWSKCPLAKAYAHWDDYIVDRPSDTAAS